MVTAIRHSGSTARWCALLALWLASAPALAAPGLQQRLEQLLVDSGLAQPGELRPVNIFGDDDPSNGVEDSRINMASPQWHDRDRRPWSMGGGTLHCDGRHRGSAMIVDTREHGGLRHGLIVMSSAHVLYDLDSGRPYQACRFHYMGLDQLPGYQAEVDLTRSRHGRFDPAGPRELPGFGREDWAFLYVPDLPPGVAGSERLRLLPYAELPADWAAAAHYQFFAYSKSLGGMTVSTACSVVESGRGDLGGGGWPGHLLDDCDSEGGASGGGLVASVGAEHYLVGIRSGAHWDGERFTASEYPLGPPDGARWDIASNTNFSRAIDRELIAVLAQMVHGLRQQVK
jgi:hypothetical protein